MTISQFFSILRARWWVALLVLLITVAAVVGVSLLLPKKYTATASVVVDPKPDPVSAMMYPGMASPAYMATQVDIIQSDRVAQRVVRNLKLNESPQVRGQWLEATGGKGSIEVWLGDQFKRSMDVKPSRESNVITVSYVAPDPAFAAGLANAFVQSYIDTTLEMKVNPAKQYSSFFETRAKEAREALERAQAKLSEFQRGNGIIATDERLDVESSRLNELSSQLVALQAVASESRSRQSQAIGASGDRLPEVLNNPLLVGLRTDITRLEGRLKELGSRFGDNHPQVIEAKANLGELRSRLESETRRTTSSVGVSDVINRQREAQTRADLDAQRAKLLRLKALRDELQVLNRDVESAQRGYDAVLGRLTQTSMESQTTQSSVYSLSPANAPLEASSPRVLFNALLAVFGGTLLGVLAALGLEMMDRRLRGPQDIVDLVGVSVLAVLPKGTGKQISSSSRKLSAMQKRVLNAPAPRALKGA
jgi:polysaccharide biosynthesis transport protein